MLKMEKKWKLVKWIATQHDLEMNEKNPQYLALIILFLCGCNKKNHIYFSINKRFVAKREGSICCGRMSFFWAIFLPFPNQVANSRRIDVAKIGAACVDYRCEINRHVFTKHKSQASKTKRRLIYERNKRKKIVDKNIHKTSIKNQYN